MASVYNISLKITVNKTDPETLVQTEETTFPNETFARMTHLSAEFYDLIAKLQKEKK
jgi:hypothetical protein